MYSAARRIADGYSLGAAAADTGAVARAGHVAARLHRHRRRRASEAASVLRRAAIGSGQHSPSGRRPVAGPRARVGSGGSARAERRISRFGRTHRAGMSRCSCWRRARADSCKPRFLVAWLLVCRRHRAPLLPAQSRLDRRPPCHDARPGGEHGGPPHAARAASAGSLARRRRRSARGVSETSKAMDHSTARAARHRAARLAGARASRPGARVRRRHASTASIAIAVGGMLLAYRACEAASAGAWQLAGAAVAWQRASVLYRAAHTNRADRLAGRSRLGDLDGCARSARPGFPLQPERTDPVLRGCSLRISPGERWCWKANRAAENRRSFRCWSACAMPDSGTATASTVSTAQTLGADAWRNRIAAAPQFHENHVLAETFAFNLLMGRRTLPSPADCRSRRDLPRARLGDLLRAHARRHAANGRRNRLAAFARRAQPPLHRARAAARRRSWWCSTKVSRRSIRKI